MPRQRAAREEGEHRRRRRRAAGSRAAPRSPVAGPRRRPARRSGARVQPVVRDEGGVEAAHAGEAAGQRHLRHRQARVGEQLLGRQQPARLQVLQRRDAELRLEDAAQVAVAHAQPRGQRCDGAGAVVAPRRRARRAAGRPAAPGCARRPRSTSCSRVRRQLGPAAQAGPEARGLGLRRVAEEAAVLAPRQLHAADRPAVDAGAR